MKAATASLKEEGASLQLDASSLQQHLILQPRGGGRTEPVTDWRRELATMADLMAALIIRHEDPEHRYRTAVEIGQDIVYTTGSDLRRQFGRVFDPIVDGYEAKFTHRR